MITRWMGTNRVAPVFTFNKLTDEVVEKSVKMFIEKMWHIEQIASLYNVQLMSLRDKIKKKIGMDRYDGIMKQQAYNKIWM